MDIGNALGLALDHFTAKRYEECALLCQQVVMYDSEVADAWQLWGTVEFQCGNYHAAAALMRRSVDLDESAANYCANFSEALLAINKPEQAKKSALRAIELNPQLAEAYNNLGIAHDRLNEPDEADKALKTAIQLDPSMSAAYVNRLSTLGRAEQINFGIEFGMKAMEISPNTPEIPWNLSLLLLKAGRWMEAWPHYQHRWACSKFPSPRWHFVQPHWNGAPFDGTLLIHAEQGHGDTIMLSRYLQLVRPHVKHVVWHVQPGLAELCKAIAPWAEVADWGTMSKFDQHAAMFDLPFIFETTPEHVPPVAGAKIKPLGVMPAGFKIGYCYNGSSIHANNANRSAMVEDFAPLQDVGATLVNLTQGKPPLDGSIDPMPLAKDWVTTAHIIAELDLIVTVDTAVAHLAATLGKPVICLLPSVNVDWRWMMKGENTPWYPSMRLVRKRADQTWRDVVGGVAANLREVRNQSIGMHMAESMADGQEPNLSDLAVAV
jgi:tetratricopeptide (TPR) repeat protein